MQSIPYHNGPLPSKQLETLQSALLAWYERQRRDLPWRATDDPYAKLVAEVMLQQTQVDRVIPKYREFLGLFPTFEALAEAARAEVIRAWSSLGYNMRAVRLHDIARRVVEEHGGTLPSDPATLRTFKGLGPYTVAALASFAFGRDAAVVDTNVRRVLTRLAGYTERPSPKELDALAQSVLPAGRSPDWNQAMMDLGATVCLPRPRCGACPIEAHCASAPVFKRGDGAIAEQRAAYAAPRQSMFEGSTRYYRGRVVEALRLAPNGLRLSQLRDVVQPEAALTEFAALVEGLRRDGLVEVYAGGDAGAAVVQLP
ncbi:MAG: A/G-specific adenine glycosylase [SAR202 cluster bacterium]|nr:A/G-specific adenine glycosylase [SAR202 cluster bacterium]